MCKIHNHSVIITWCQSGSVFQSVNLIVEMNLCKSPDPLCLTGNNAKNWREFKEQLQWFLAGTESNDKSDAVRISLASLVVWLARLVRIGIMLSHAGKEAREIYKTLTWREDGDKDKFDKVLEAFERFCLPQKNTDTI